MLYTYHLGRSKIEWQAIGITKKPPVSCTLPGKNSLRQGLPGKISSLNTRSYRRRPGDPIYTWN
jgi:hypothetical protein